MTPITSNNVAAIAYDPGSHTLRVRFHTGGTYDYYGIPARLHKAMLQPHPWHLVGPEIRSYPYNKVN